MSREDPRPVIAVCAPLERARWAVWDMDAAVVSRMYLDAVWGAGGLAVLIPPDPELADAPDEILGRVDGLMMLGGADLHAGRYGQEPHATAEEYQPVRDAVEIALAARAMERHQPVLGICRGIQVLNVACGGTLTQHLPDTLGNDEHRRIVGAFEGNDHPVSVTPGSLLERVVGDAPHRVYSHHHQAVDRVADGFAVTGRADDGTVEALERDHPGGYLLGVQWHPEADPGSPVIASLVAAAREYRHTHALE